MDAKYELGIAKRHLANLDLALEEAEYDKAKLQTELTLTRRELAELQLQINILKHQLQVANAEADAYKADAIKWAKAHDDVRYEYQKCAAYITEKRNKA